MAQTVGSARSAVLDYSPTTTKKEGNDKENDIPVLRLIQFSKVPFVGFGSVKLGTSRCAVLRVENPVEDVAAQVAIDRIPSSKGFSVDRAQFTVQSEDFFSLTITWTPTEEGGIRELITFIANGVLKTQAILLGRAEAPKKKKKSLWDSIKNKKVGNQSATPRVTKTEPSLKLTANKTFRVSRKPQYKLQNPRSPLMSLNVRAPIREGSPSKHNPVEGSPEQLEQKVCEPLQRQRSLALPNQVCVESVHNVRKSSPIVLLVPAADFMDPAPTSASSRCLGTPESAVLTRGLSMFKSLKPSTQSIESPAPDTGHAKVDDGDNMPPGPPVLSVRDALALIESDLAHVSISPSKKCSSCDSENMPPGSTVLSVRDALAQIESDLAHVSVSPLKECSSCDFSDSLESVSGGHGYAPDKTVLKTIPISPAQSAESGEQRLTFFVPQTTVKNKIVLPEVDNAALRVKKAPFMSATVTKTKAPAATAPDEVNIPSGRKLKKSRRRLMEKTLELSDGNSQCESGPGTPGLPVIDSYPRNDGWQTATGTSSANNSRQQGDLSAFMNVTPELDGSPIHVTSPPSMAPSLATFPISPVPAPGAFAANPPPRVVTSSPLQHRPPSLVDVCESSVAAAPPKPASAPLLVQADLTFPIHSQTEFDMKVRNKKRKSEGEAYLMNEENADATEKAERVKRSRVAVMRGPERPASEKSVVSQRRQPRKSGTIRSTSASSIKTKKSVGPAQAKLICSKPTPQGTICSTSASSIKTKRSIGPARAKQMSFKPTPQGARSRKSSAVHPVKTAKVVAVAQSKLTFIKPAQTAIPRHPMPFAAKNMFYDERWIEKQERGFTWWINNFLTPDDFKVNNEVTKVNALSIATGNYDKFNMPKAPTKEEVSFRTYTAQRRLNRLRRSACQLFTSESMVKAIQRLELEVEARRLLVRKDRHIWKDIGERQKVLNWLLSYNPLWLRIGLETIYGELISLESNSDVLGLAMFILRRMLWNPDIAAEFRHAKVPHLYKDGHEEALSCFTLKKLLLLMCFLDKAKESRLIEHDPCLFCMDAEFKSSKDLLLAFSRDFLSGEGILPRHLGYLGLPVSHVQTPLDEFDFAVKNLAVDLRCGIRLVRVMELFIQDWSLSQKLRLPTVSRLQKIHNVDLAIQVLKAKGVDLKNEHGSTIESRDIVDGHREKTLSLLWKIIFAFQVEVILDEEQLREEIAYLRRTLWTKRKLVSLRKDNLPQRIAKTRVQYEHSSTKISLLMEWVNAVCDFYNLQAENFTVSFSDGRILCYLIHHYHPGHLPKEAVSHCTTQTVECSHRGRLELDCFTSDSDNSFDSWPNGHSGPELPSVEFKQLLENEKNNFRLVNEAVAYLGGVPAMIHVADMSNTIPNEKVVMSYLSFLCARLLDLRNETRAARVIQGAWRKYRLRKDLELYRERTLAAAKIQMYVRNFLQRRRAKRQNLAAIIIQACWRGYQTRKELRIRKEAQLWALRHNAATAIQAHWRMYSAMRSYQRLRYNAIVVQALWRMKKAASTYGKIHWAVRVIQKYTRAWSLAKREREQYLSLRAAVVKLQRGYHRWKTQKLERSNRAARVIQAAFRKWQETKTMKKNAAAMKIQSWYRMHRCLHRYSKVKRSIVLIQALSRGYIERRRFQMMRLQHNSATVIQSVFRGYIVRKWLEKMRHASVIIQCWYRASVKRDVERQEFVKMRSAAITIQAAYRGHVARGLLKEQHQAATVIQAAFRRFSAKSHYMTLKKAATAIQQHYRAMVLAQRLKKEFDTLRYSVLIVQAVWRGRAERKRIEKLHQCATLIQARYRQHKAQAQFRSRKAAAEVIQRHFRAYIAGKVMRVEYLQLKVAVVTLQAGFRGMRVRTDLKKKHQAATVIQSAVRMFLHRKHYLHIQSAVIIIQNRYRALLKSRDHQCQYRHLKQAATKVQAAYRGIRVRKDLKRKHKAATVIQAQFRMHKIRVVYLATKCAAIIVQERYRAKRLGDQLVLKYRALKSAALVIQAAYRGHKARVRVAEMHKAAILLQRWFLTIQERKRFLAIKDAALLCQRRYRAATLARKERLNYLLKHRAAISLQAAYRGMRIRKQLGVERTAAIRIQSNVRMYLQKKYYKQLCWAANIVQAKFRANKEMREEMQALAAKRNAAMVLQASFRGMKLRQSIRQSHQAASSIQRAYRAHRERKRYLALKSSALTIQRRYRAAIAATQQMRQYQRMRRAAIILQAVYRGWQVRKKVVQQHEAAIKIQSEFRKHREQVKFQAMRMSAIIIQRYYRACVLRRQGRDHFLKMRRSAIALQAAFRGHSVRKNLARMHRAATVIQGNFKRCKQQTAFRRQRWAAIVVQQRFRAQRQKSFERKNYQKLRKAVITLQAAYRGMKLRQTIRQSHQAASCIQRAYRAHREHKKYLALKVSVITIQRHYRSALAASQQMRQYQKMRRAAIILQTVYRGWQVRKKVVQQHEAAIIIQSEFRKHREQVKFQAMRMSAIIIQRYYRACVLRRQERDHFLKMRHSAVTLQAAFRGRYVRKNLARMHRAATVIQGNFKRRKQQTAFRRQRWAAIVVQQRFRAQRQKSFERKNYQKLRKAVITLQAAYRGMKLRQTIRQSHQAASSIQRAYRAHRERKRYLTLKSSALTIQQRYRAAIAATQQMQQYQRMRRAAIILQAVYRGWQVRKKVVQQHEAAIKIQSEFRKHREQVKFQAMRMSAIIIQRYYRACVLRRRRRDHFLKMRHSAVTLQAAFRGRYVRKNLARMHRAATVIQGNFKRRKQQTAFRRQRWAAIVVQQRFRAQRQKSFERKNYQKLRKAVITLQAAYRGMKLRQIIRQSHQAASSIQRAYRAHRERKKYLALKSSVITIQRHYRSALATSQQMRQYQKMRRAAIILQAVYRGWQVRKKVVQQHEAAIIIQSEFRKHREQVKFQAMRMSAIIIQRYYRACVLRRQERDHFLKMRRSAVTLQAAFRGHYVRKNLARMHRAATVIQGNFKRRKQQTAFRRQRWAGIVVQQRFRAQRQKSFERKNYQKIRNAVLTLQAAYRGMILRHDIRQSHQAASSIQRAYRAYRERKRYLTLKSSTVIIQRHYRATVTTKQQMRQYQKLRKAIVVLQATYRGQQVRKKVVQQHEAAMKIQSEFRKHREQMRFQAMRVSAINIQRYYRSYIICKREREHFLKIKQSAITLQAVLRGHLARREIGQQNKAATMIQSCWRCYVKRHAFQRQKEATIALQRKVRAVLLARAERNNYIRIREATITLQAHCRGWIARQQALAAAKSERRLRFSAAVFHHLCAMRIQRALRAHWVLQYAKKQLHSVITIQRWMRARQQRRRFLEEKRKVITAQRAVRRWLACRHQAATVIQHAARRFLLLKRQMRVERGLVKAQALWRGHRSRLHNDNSKVVKIRHRLHRLSNTVQEEDKLYHKMSSALDYLLRYRHFSNILLALKNLEIATRLSPECCERLVESGATLVLFTLIRSCNRSVPCMDIITFSIQILLNLSKYHKTIEAVYAVENSVETLVDLLVRYREKAGDKVADKGGNIFSKSCFLLILLLQDQHRTLEIRKIPKVLDRIRSIYKLTAHKHKMDAERTIIKQKMDTSINGSFLVQATPRKSRPVLKKFAPDWVLRKDKLKDIVDPLIAIQMVAETFSITL